MIIITLRIRILFLTPFVASCCRAFKLATGGTQRFSSPRVARLRDLRVLNHYRRWHVPGLGLKISADQPAKVSLLGIRPGGRCFRGCRLLFLSTRAQA